MSAVWYLLNVSDGNISFHFVDQRQPLRTVTRFDEWEQVFEHSSEITGQSNIHFDILVEFGRIDVNVNLSRVRRVRLQVTGHSIVEAHPESQ